MSIQSISIGHESVPGPENSLYEESSSSIENNAFHSETMSMPLDLTTSPSNVNDGRLPSAPSRHLSFFNAPQNTFSKNASTSIPGLSPEFSPENVWKPVADYSSIPMPEDLSAASSQSMELATPDLSIDESKSRVAVSFLLKKSKRLCGAIRFYLSKPATANSTKLRSIMSSLKDSVKNTLAKSVPSSKTISQITSSLVSTLKGKRLPDCLRFIGFSLTSFNKRKKVKANVENGSSILPMFAKPSVDQNQQSDNGTFLNPIKKPELNHLSGFQFVKPKFYECSYCVTRFYKLPVYIKHIRRHVDHHQIIRCESCDKAFSSVINKRRHQLQCRKRAIL